MAGVLLETLQIELETDPNGYGYAPHIASGHMQVLADMLNLVRPELSVSRELILREEVLACFDLAEMEAVDAATPGSLDYIYLLTGQDFHMQFQVSGNFRIYQDCWDDLVAIVMPTNAPLTDAALNSIENRTGSRGESLFEAGTVVTWQDCSNALALP